MNSVDSRLRLSTEHGDGLEDAQAVANHESPRTSELYDRSQHEISLGEVERIRI